MNNKQDSVTNYTEYMDQSHLLYMDFSSVLKREKYFLQELMQMKLDLKESDQVLSIGCGMGEIEISMYENFKFHLYALDASKVYLKVMQSLLDQKFRADEGNIKVLHHKFEHFSTDKKFNLILSIHSWYGFGLEKSILDKALNLLSPGGYLLIQVISRAC